MHRYPDLLQLFMHHRRPSEGLWNALCDLIRMKSYHPREVWMEMGAITDRIAVIQKGAALAYQVDQDKRKLVRVWKEKDLILLAESGLAYRKTEIQILFPVDTHTLELSYEELRTLRQHHPEMQQYFDGFIADELHALLKHIQWIKSRTATQRIVDFKKEHPILHHVLPEDHIASYLGMSKRWYNLKK